MAAPQKGVEGISAWRDLSTTSGQRYWGEVCAAERRLQSNWKGDRERRALADTAPAPRPGSPLTTGISAHTGHWETRKLPTNTSAHRFGETRAPPPFSAYEQRLVEAASLARPAEATSSAADWPRKAHAPVLGSTTSLATPWAQSLVANALDPARAMLQRSRSEAAAPRRASGGPRGKGTELLRQEQFQGAAGKPHPRELSGTRPLPAPLDRSLTASQGLYLPTAEDMRALRAKEQGKRARMRAQLDETIAQLEQEARARESSKHRSQLGSS
jgi:hypothetical protein